AFDVVEAVRAANGGVAGLCHPLDVMNIFMLLLVIQFDDGISTCCERRYGLFGHYQHEGWGGE
ncbi:hypothetical protein Tco_0560340, partial [Tanacetum coccineum]